MGDASTAPAGPTDPPSRVPATAAALTRAGQALLGALALLPLSSFLVTGSSLVSKLLVAAMAALSFASPLSGLLVCAALLPIDRTLGLALGSVASLGEPLTLAFLGGWLIRSAARRAEPADPLARAIVRPALALAAVVAASGAVEAYVLQRGVGYPSQFAREAWRYLVGGGFVVERSAFDALANAAGPLEGLGLFAAAVTLSRRAPEAGRRVLRMAAAGAAAVAVFNIQRLLSVAARSGDFWADLAQRLPTIRISSVFPDLNAAGSYFAMLLLVALGLAFHARGSGGAGAAGDGRRLGARGPWLLLSALLWVALWLAGSRVAVVAAVVTAAAMLPFLPRPGRWAMAVGVVLILLAIAPAVPSLNSRFNPPRSTGRAVPLALMYRTETTRAALRMFAAQPVFGVGVGQFYATSIEYLSPSFRQDVPRENAHNNFLQVLAELGLVGFALFAWTAAAIARQLAAGLRARSAPPLAVGTAAGLLAFGLTCLAGHPLLIPEVATAFWIVLGSLGGLVGQSVPVGTRQRIEARGRWLRWVAFATAAVAIVLVPYRGHVAVAKADLELVTIGLSGWETGEDGVPFRRLLGPAQFYVDGAATAVRLPLRLDARGPSSADVEIRLDGALASAVHLSGSEWQSVSFLLPRDRKGRRYRPIDLVAASGGTVEARQAWPAVLAGRADVTVPKRR